MLTGFLINIIFLQVFFIWFTEYKRQEKLATARAKFRAELQEIINEAITNVECDCTWEESDVDMLLDWYIHEDYLWKDTDEN